MGLRAYLYGLGSIGLRFYRVSGLSRSRLSGCRVHGV